MDPWQQWLPRRLLAKKSPVSSTAHRDTNIPSALLRQPSPLWILSPAVSAPYRLPGRLFALMCCNRNLVLLLIASANCSSNSFLACLIIFLHLICQSLWSFLFSSFGYSFCFLNDVFSILITSFTSQIFSSLLHHTCFFLLFFKLFLTDRMHRSPAFSRMCFGSASQKDFILLAFSFCFFIMKFPHFCILPLFKVQHYCGEFLLFAAFRGDVGSKYIMVTVLVVFFLWNFEPEPTWSLVPWCKIFWEPEINVI